MEATKQRENMLPAKKPEMCIHVCPLVSGMKLQDLEFSMLYLSLVIVQYFLPMTPLLPFRIDMHIWCHCVLEVSDFLSDFSGD